MCMRITSTEIEIIKSVILAYISDAKVMLFGSRTDDSKKGGDIDIFVETSKDVNLKDKIKILAQIEISGLQRKVDLIVKTPKSPEQNIFKTIQQEGIVL